MRFSARNACALRGKQQPAQGIALGYRANLSRGSRRRGQSARAKHDYHARQGEYLVGCDGARDDLQATGFGNLPAFAQCDPGEFWLAADSFERANASLFIDLQFNLPAELPLVAQTDIVRVYCDRMFDPLRLPYSWAIHGGDGKNPHIHLMLSERMTGDHDRPAAQHFRRYNAAYPGRGGAQKTRELQPKGWLMQARGAWAEEVNRALVAAGHDPRFDHRSLEVRRDEALERGQWRRAAELNTLVEQHEGPRIAGMRRRLKRGFVELEGLPEYAQAVIAGNDAIRADNAAYLARIKQMSDDDLRLMQADDILRLAREHLSGAERCELIELEKLERDDHRSALEALAEAQQAAELAELIDLEQDVQQTALLAIEREQAHGAALIENSPMRRLEQTRACIEQLRARVEAPDPAVIVEVLIAREAVERLDADANAWRTAHPVRAWLAGSETAHERAAREAKEAYTASPKLLEVRAVLAERKRDRAELERLEKQLPDLERAAGIEPKADQDERSRSLLQLGASDLRKAVGTMENHAMRCPYELREALHELRRQIVQELRQIEQLIKLPPPPVEAAELRQHASERYSEARGWRDAQDAALAAAQAEQLLEREQRRQQTSEAPKPRGPRLG